MARLLVRRIDLQQHHMLGVMAADDGLAQHGAILVVRQTAGQHLEVTNRYRTLRGSTRASTG